MSTKFLHFNVILPPKASLKQRKQYQSRTVAIEPKDASEIYSLAALFTTAPEKVDIMVNVLLGVTFLSLKDRYSKKEGRLNAVAKQASVDLPITGVTVTKTHLFVQLAEYKGVTLLLRVNKDTGYSTVTGTLTLGN